MMGALLWAALNTLCVAATSAATGVAATPARASSMP